MKIRKSFFFSLVIVGSLVIIIFLIFWVPSFFAEEFNYVYLTYSDGSLSVTTDPSDLFEKNISRWTDISATFRNSSQIECNVTVQSETLKQSFNVASGREYGIILPKKKDIIISFCGLQKKIRIN